MKPINKSHLTIIDRPCGSGKTSKFIRSFDPEERYLVVTPYLTEVERIIENANVEFHQPMDADTKAEDLKELLLEGCNVVTTHKLYQEIAGLAQQGYLNSHHIIIDEVLDVCRRVDGKTPRSFQKFYLEDGFATVGDDGKITPTPQWDAEFDAVSDTLAPHIYKLAAAGMLYLVDGEFFMWALPKALLYAGRSITVYTYLAEGSMLLAYLRKLGIQYTHDTDVELESVFRKKAKELITIETLPALERHSFSFNKQSNARGKRKRDDRVATTLKNLRERTLSDVPMDHVLITCAKENWYKNGKDGKGGGIARPDGFSKGSRMFTSTNWVANTTRGTNLYSHCSHLIYLYDQFMNQYIRRWLGFSADADDRYALTELIQWIYRSRVRKGEPITVYLPSKRMRRLLENWLNFTDYDLFRFSRISTGSQLA